jgi:hypothetical protein
MRNPNQIKVNIARNTKKDIKITIELIEDICYNRFKSPEHLVGTVEYHKTLIKRMHTSLSHESASPTPDDFGVLRLLTKIIKQMDRLQEHHEQNENTSKDTTLLLNYLNELELQMELMKDRAEFKLNN